ncbi:MAG: biotin--[acetyl-CoA-carboxylase] ligase [Candidatus Kapaibacteriota bacterium]
MKSFHYDIVDSTNTIAKQLLNEYDEVIVTADKQSSGRGRNGHMWLSGDATDIIFSYALNIQPGLNIKPIVFQACAALAVQAFLFEIFPNTVKIALKYPNDVYIEFLEKSGKISGSLIEVEYIGKDIRSIIVGIGININSTSFSLSSHSHTMTVSDVLMKKIDLEKMYVLFTQHFLSCLGQSSEDIFSRWARELQIIGKSIYHVQSGKYFTVQSINDDGFIVCTDGTEQITLFSGDSFRYDLF